MVVLLDFMDIDLIWVRQLYSAARVTRATHVLRMPQFLWSFLIPRSFRPSVRLRLYSDRVIDWCVDLEIGYLRLLLSACSCPIDIDIAFSLDLSILPENGVILVRPV
jgi:hypothetical protein